MLGKYLESLECVGPRAMRKTIGLRSRSADSNRFAKRKEAWCREGDLNPHILSDTGF